MKQISKSVYVQTEGGRISPPSLEPYSMYRGSNLGCIVTEKGLIQIDTAKHPIHALNWIDLVRKISDMEFLYIINTDHHLDHIIGNYCFDAPVISHYLARNEIEKFKSFDPLKISPLMGTTQLMGMFENRDEAFIQKLLNIIEDMEGKLRDSYEKLRIILAEITFGDKLILYVGDMRLELIHVGGHTVGSILAYLPEEKVLFSGDLVFNNLLPNMVHADTEKWLKVLTMIEKMDVEIIVPGHGYPCDKGPLEKLRQYIQEVRNTVNVLRKRGYNREEVIAEIDMTSFFPVDNELGWTTERIRAWSKNNVGRVFDEFNHIEM